MPPLKRELLCKQGITNSEGARVPLARDVGVAEPRCLGSIVNRPVCTPGGGGLLLLRATRAGVSSCPSRYYALCVCVYK